MIKSRSKYYYSRLGDSQKEVYKSLLLQWEKLEENPIVKVGNLKSEEITKIIKFINLDNPGLFYLDFSQFSYSLGNGLLRIDMKFVFPRKAILQIEEKLNKVIQKVITKEVLALKDQFSKELVIHDYLAKKVKYVSDGSFSQYTIVGALLKNKAVCDGYAKAFKLLCDKVEIPCILIHGEADNGAIDSGNGHAWNIVKLGKKHAHVDVTWDSTGSINDASIYSHLNLTDSQIKKDHTWNDKLLPKCEADELNYYSQIGESVVSAKQYKEFIKSQIDQHKKVFSVRVVGKEKNQETVMNVTRKILGQLRPFGYSYSLTYNKKRGIITIEMK